MAISAFWFWPLVQAPTHHTCSWHLCVLGHFRDGPAAFAIASPLWQAAFPLGRHLQEHQEQVCRGAAFPYATPQLSLSPPGCWPQKKGAQLANQGDGSPCSRSELGWGDMKIGMIFYKLNLQNCRAFKATCKVENEAFTLRGFHKLWFGTTFLSKEWESGGWSYRHDAKRWDSTKSPISATRIWTVL